MIRQAVILAGGEGTRLRPVTLEIPKPLVPVKGIPIITWQIKWLKRFGISDVLVLIPPKWERVFKDWQMDLQQEIVEPKIELWTEPEPMGTLGALVHFFSSRWQESIIVTNGDELKGLDIEALVQIHEQNGFDATIGLVSVPNPCDYGVAEMDGLNIKQFHEKPSHPPSSLISSGLYCVHPRVFQRMDQSKKSLMFEKDLFPCLAAEARLGGAELKGPWYDCGTLERWERAIREWDGSSIADR